MAAPAAEAKEVVESTFGHALKVVGKYLAPVVGIVAGYLGGQAVGGASGLSNIVYKIGGGNATGAPGISAANAWRISAVIMVVLSVSIAGVFWAMRRGGQWQEIVGGLIGGFFIGVALFNASIIITGQGVPGGFIESLEGGIEGIASGH
jgi:hypothetical protein